jgi:hypothetical protein
MPRRLTKLRIDEISAVMEGAGVGTKIMLRKSAQRDAAFAKATRRLATSVKSILADPDCDRDGMLAKTFAQYQDHLNMLMKRYPKNANLDVAVDEADNDEGMPDDATRTERLSDDRDDDDEDDEKENAMTAKLKSLDAVKICKQISNDGHAFGLSEHDLTNLIQSYAKSHAKSGESDAQAFSRIISGSDDVAKACNTALAIAKHQQWQSRTSTTSKAQSSSMFHAGDENYFSGGGSPGRATLQPRQVGGADARAVNNPKSALDGLQKLVDQQRAANPTLTEAGAFAQVYTDPKNAALAARERDENRPTSAAWGG